MGLTHGSVDTAVSDNIMVGALLIKFAIVSISTGTMFIWVGRDKVFEKATAFVDGATNAFAA